MPWFEHLPLLTIIRWYKLFHFTVPNIVFTWKSHSNFDLLVWNRKTPMRRLADIKEKHEDCSSCQLKLRFCKQIVKVSTAVISKTRWYCSLPCRLKVWFTDITFNSGEIKKVIFFTGSNFKWHQKYVSNRSVVLNIHQISNLYTETDYLFWHHDS